ncbi:MAG: GNAT family N-acyltransferase [Alphaproteobacteria bacterium]
MQNDDTNEPSAPVPGTPVVTVRLAENQSEIEEAQRLRYRVFYEELAAAPDMELAAIRLDRDDFDKYADHLVVVNKNAPSGERIVGTYRLLRRDLAMKFGGFYTSTEFDISSLLDSGHSLLELGRSCVMPEYRTRPVMQLLWQGIADYMSDHKIDLLFGCASLHGTDIKNISTPLSYLHHYHLAPEILRPRALKGRYINMNIIPKEDIDRKRAFTKLPPLIKGYLRVGAMIGDGAVIDEQFNTTDVCILMQTSMIGSRYRKHYERKIQKTLTGGDNIEPFPPLPKTRDPDEIY